jgi:hypothetical protein
MIIGEQISDIQRTLRYTGYYRTVTRNLMVMSCLEWAKAQIDLRKIAIKVRMQFFYWTR